MKFPVLVGPIPSFLEHRPLLVPGQAAPQVICILTSRAPVARLAALPRRAGLHVTGDASTDADGLGDASATRWGSTTASRWSLELGHGGKVPGIGVSAKILEVDLQSIFGSKCILQVAGTSHVASLRAVAR